MPGGSYSKGAGVSRDAKRIRIRLNWSTQLTPVVGSFTAGEIALRAISTICKTPNSTSCSKVLDGPRSTVSSSSSLWSGESRPPLYTIISVVPAGTKCPTRRITRAFTRYDFASAPTAIHNWETTVSSDVSGYIRFVDRKRLVGLAKAHRVKIDVLRRVGHFVPAGVPLLAVSKEGRLTPEAMDELRGAFDFGPTRTLQQDVEFGVLQIVDIALKAISPAVNDPSTAINCVDQLSAIMIRFASREPPEAVLYDPPGTVRVIIPWIGFDRLLEAAFEQIRLYSKSDVAVSLRLLRALGDIAATTPDPEYRGTLAERGRRVVAGCAEKLGEEELQSLRARLEALLTPDS